MAEKAFLQIKDAEAQAKALIRKVEDDALQIVKRAENERADALAKLSEDNVRQALERKQQIESNAQTQSLEFSKETTKLCSALEKELSSQKKKAINAVIQFITE